MQQETMTFSVALFVAAILAVFLLYRYSGFFKRNNNENESHDISQFLMDVSSDAIIIIDDALCIKKINAAAETMFGYQSRDVSNISIIGTLVSDEQKADFRKILQYFKNKNDNSLHSFYFDLLNKNGLAMEVSARIAFSGSQGNNQYILYVQDMSQQLAAEEKLHQATYSDDLTGLPNRYMAGQHIYQGISDAKRRGRNLVVMEIGLDRFKNVNESLGRDVGNNLLVKIAGRLKEINRRGDLVSRISGDQFVVTLVDVAKETNLDGLVRKYVDSFNQPFYIDEHVLHITVSIGISCYPDDASNVDSLLRNCESAMFSAKRKGGTEFRYFSQEMRRISSERLYLENELRCAIERNQLAVFYQPQVILSTGKIEGVEALVRWNHPELGMVPPMKFIPVAEEVGLISEIGEWVLKRACADMSLIRNERDDDLRLSINLSARQFQSEHGQESDLIKIIADALHETDFPPSSLELEITESLFVEDIDNVADTLRVLSKQGIRISMDDFGTGYSSLSYLKKFPINTIKVDRSFVKDITTDKDDASIVTATIQMAHSLNLDIVAEGVETEEQLQFLISKKCDKIQGYYFSRPLSYKALVNLMEENREIEINSGNVCLISRCG